MRTFLLKSCILSAALLFLSTQSSAQIFVGDVDINKQDSISVVEVYVGRRGPGNWVLVHVDYGQQGNATVKGLGSRNDQSTIIDPESRTRIIFKSTAAVLNFFERNNWDYVNSLSKNDPDSSGFYYYFKKRKNTVL